MGWVSSLILADSFESWGGKRAKQVGSVINTSFILQRDVTVAWNIWHRFNFSRASSSKQHRPQPKHIKKPEGPSLGSSLVGVLKMDRRKPCWKIWKWFQVRLENDCYQLHSFMGWRTPEHTSQGRCKIMITKGQQVGTLTTWQSGMF